MSILGSSVRGLHRSARGNDLVDIISGSFGAGHDAAAHAIADRLHNRGFTPRIWDIVDLMPGALGRGLRAAYLQQIRVAPANYRWLARHTQQGSGINKIMGRGMECAHKSLLDIASDQPALIMSTHPMASQALGELRALGRLQSPVVTYLTDMSVHRVWVHRAVDLHLALHSLPAEEATRFGAGPTRVIRAAIPPHFSASPSLRSKEGARSVLGLPLRRPLVLVTGGSCGIGDLEQSALDIAATGTATPVVLCAHNERLKRRLQTSPYAIALGWVDDMRLVLDAVDVVVQNAGGFTSLETLAAGVPTVTYRSIPGHGEANAAALEKAGLVPWIKGRADLRDGLRSALLAAGENRAPRLRADDPDVVDALVAGPLATV